MDICPGCSQRGDSVTGGDAASPVGCAISPRAVASADFDRGGAADFVSSYAQD